MPSLATLQENDYDKVAALIREASARFILPRYKALKDGEVSSKSGPNDLVTLADIEAEAFLAEALPDILRGSVVIGEESVSRGESDLSAITQLDQAVWVVDPVDGTYNFVHGGREFGVMVALVQGGECIAGWIYDVLNDTLTRTTKGEGVYEETRQISIPPLNVDEQRFEDLIVHLSPKFFPAAIRQNIKAKAQSMDNIRSVGSAAHEYLKIVRGLSHSAVYCRLKPWDHLAGTLMVEEAGGFVQKWDKSRYTPRDSYAGLIAASNEQTWESVFETFFADIDLSQLSPPKK
ncbi:MAG: inositol monophosphatase family protein [Alphaproteobacteria bacterium]